MVQLLVEEAEDKVGYIVAYVLWAEGETSMLTAADFGEAPGEVVGWASPVSAIDAVLHWQERSEGV